MAGRRLLLILSRRRRQHIPRRPRLLNAFARLRCCAAVVLTSTTLNQAFGAHRVREGPRRAPRARHAPLSHGARRTRGRCGNFAANADQPPALSTAPSSFASCAPSSRSASMSMPRARSPVPGRCRLYLKTLPPPRRAGEREARAVADVVARAPREQPRHTIEPAPRHGDVRRPGGRRSLHRPCSTSALQTSTRVSSVRTWPRMQAPLRGMRARHRAVMPPTNRRRSRLRLADDAAAARRCRGAPRTGGSRDARIVAAQRPAVGTS